ncbi:outer membrane beta-barrel protein [Flavobacterium rakeshii]|uniref:Outer membrane beta-barrel protein n=1 Tax=Flavobacterium rakeshii TaxID=1038845 RepID=A0A6N8HEC1_9FLAO|nr:porin family protein [Flavobacterium rakeshii]MUV03217.1 outer membrane beta-barrel protein [Flavobacterium rakeshii]
MKRLIKLFSAGILMIGTITTANAQSSDALTPSFGIKGGVNFASITGDDFNSPDSRTSFHVGLLAEFPLTEMFSLQAEALYSGQGFESDMDGEIFGGEGKVEYQLDYINVPVLAKVYILDGLSIEAGPQFGFKVNEEIDANANADDGDLNLDEAEDFDFGVAAGVTFETPMGLFATGRYTQGFTDIVNNRDIKNSVFQIGVGYKF